MSLRRLAITTALAVQVGVVSLAAPAHAEFIITFAQVGADVVATGSGTIDLTGLRTGGTSAFYPFVNGRLGNVALAQSSPEGQFYLGTSGPSSFGSGDLIFADAGTGPLVVVEGANSLIVVPFGYTSGSALSNSATWLSTTIANLGLTPGTYTESWNTTPPSEVSAGFDGRSIDDIKVIIPSIASVPEPASLALMVLPVVVMGMARRRRTKVA